MFDQAYQPTDFSNVRIDILELVQNVLEQPAFTGDLIGLLDDDLQAPMSAIVAAVECQDQAAAQTALQALTVALEG